MEWSKNLSEFESYVQEAPGNAQAERFVRLMLERVAKNCPLPLLAQLGQCVVEYRRNEMRDIPSN